MEPVAVRPLTRRATTGRAPADASRRVVGAVPDPSGAWLLDPEPFHDEFEQLVLHLGDPDGLDRARARASDLWRDTDPVISAYIAGLPCHTPEDWAAGFEEHHLAEWYRVVMAAYVSPAAGFRWPVRLRNRLPDLGWTPAEARRLTRGRPLVDLVGLYGGAASQAAVGLVLPSDQKGWMSADDAAELLERFRTMEPAAFRYNQHLIPLVEDAFEVLARAAGAGPRVLLLPQPPPVR